MALESSSVTSFKWTALLRILDTTLANLEAYRLGSPLNAVS